MKTKYFLFLFVLVFATAGFKCGDAKKAEQVWSKLAIELPSPLPLRNEYYTPKGVFVATVDAIPEDAKAKTFESIDSGIDSLLESTRDKGYSQKQSHAEFRILMKAPTSRSEDGNCPTLNMKDGSKIAGTVIALGRILVEPPFIYVAENFNESEICNDFLRNATRYEGEHIVAWYNDRKFYDSTTGTGDIHPLYPLPQTLPPQSEAVFNNETKPFDGQPEEKIDLYDYGFGRTK